jgi:hypothetical protein
MAAAPAPSPVTVSRLERAVELPLAAVSPPRARSLEPPFRPPIA